MSLKFMRELNKPKFNGVPKIDGKIIEKPIISPPLISPPLVTLNKEIKKLNHFKHVGCVLITPTKVYSEIEYERML